MNEQEKRDAGREFGDALRRKLADNRQDLVERLMAGRPSTEESGSPKEPDEPPRGQGRASESS
jgi:hypothetical protein